MTASVRDNSLHQMRTSSRCLCIHFLSVAIHFAHILSAIYTNIILSYVHCVIHFCVLNKPIGILSSSICLLNRWKTCTEHKRCKALTMERNTKYCCLKAAPAGGHYFKRRKRVAKFKRRKMFDRRAFILFRTQSPHAHRSCSSNIQLFSSINSSRSVYYSLISS